MCNPQDFATLTVRPYQLLCLVCLAGQDDAARWTPRLREIRDAIRANPDIPVSLRCNSCDQFAYQNPGHEDDTPEGADFNLRRDLEILRRLDLAPGTVLPARILLHRLLKAIPFVAGVCGYETVTSDAWRGCERSRSGAYEKGHARGIQALIPPRGDADMARDKQASVRDMEQTRAIRIRPHILVCAVAQYGEGIRPPFKPDNLPEMLQYILKHPDTPITLVTGADWMMCGPCPHRTAHNNGCVIGAQASGGLYNEMKDLKVLQALGLTFGTTLPAREMYARVFERIPSVEGVCALDPGIPENSLWRDGCGRNAAPCPGYAVGREQLRQEFAKV